MNKLGAGMRGHATQTIRIKRHGQRLSESHTRRRAHPPTVVPGVRAGGATPYCLWRPIVAGYKYC